MSADHPGHVPYLSKFVYQLFMLQGQFLTALVIKGRNDTSQPQHTVCNPQIFNFLSFGQSKSSSCCVVISFFPFCTPIKRLLNTICAAYPTLEWVNCYFNPGSLSQGNKKCIKAVCIKSVCLHPFCPICIWCIFLHFPTSWIW